MGKKIEYKNNNSIFLFDAGPSEDGVIHNADIFGIHFDRTDGVILSHGHFDHFTGLANILRKISLSRPKVIGINLLAHPEAFLKRWEVFQDGKNVQMPFLDEGHLKELGALIHKRTGITFLSSDESPSLLVTGEIPRKTNLRKDFHFSTSRIDLVTKQGSFQIHWLEMIKQ